MRETIDTHIELAEAYIGMMNLIENQRLFFCFEEQAVRPDAVNRRRIALQVIKTIYVFLRCIFSDNIKWENAYLFKPYIRHILSAHIRRQYQKLYSLYVAELVIQRKKEDLKDELSELREIASDIKDYSQTLPSLKVILSGALSTTGGILGIVGYNISSFFQGGQSVEIVAKEERRLIADSDKANNN